jgi:hypothetical protein
MVVVFSTFKAFISQNPGCQGFKCVGIRLCGSEYSLCAEFLSGSKLVSGSMLVSGYKLVSESKSNRHII